ncbi:MAG: ABC transporter ATP-binding protein/permease [Rickettsiales bacterium]|jgi:ABC-type multidrug transport system fused ATPase/permease subunit|nr:ABC transporter ATP-binding protein/permease [Rickettsiales bacterium]
MKTKIHKTTNDNNDLPANLMGFYWKYAVRPKLGYLSLWLFLFLLAELLMGIYYPLFQKWFVALFENYTSVDVLWSNALFLIGTYFVITLIGNTAGAYSNAMWTRWIQVQSNTLSQKMLDYTSQQSMSFWTGRMSGKINQQINYVFGGLSNFFYIALMFAAAIIMIVNIGLVFHINYYVALMLLGIFVFRFIFSLVMMRPMNRASKTAAESSSHLSGKIIDTLTNYNIIKLFAGAKIERQHLMPVRKKAVKNRLYSEFLVRIFSWLPSFVWDAMFALTTLFCVKMYIDDTMTIADIVFTTTIYISVAGNIAEIVRQIPSLVGTHGSAVKSYEELVKPIEDMDAPNATELKVKSGKIEFRGVSFHYGRKRQILSDFNLTIKPGEKIGLVGTSGAGKTTLVNLLMRFYDPRSGTILIDGQDIKNVTQDSLRTQIGFVPQEPTMFNRSLQENIGYGKFGASMREIRAAAKKADADKFIMETPKKYESLVGDRGIKLSGGQRQRVAIARVFLKNAPILVLDEATSALDSETEDSIQKSFDTLSAGRTTIAIAHRLSTLRNMDRIVVMDAGKIIESGSHSQLLRRGGKYAKLWKMQSGGFIN